MTQMQTLFREKQAKKEKEKKKKEDSKQGEWTNTSKFQNV